MDPVQLFKCLADETRLKSVLLIQLEQELCVCELVMALDEIQPKISRHLGQLKKAGILQDRKQSQWVYYRINDELPAWAKKLIDDTAQNNPLLLAAGLANLQQMGNRPERIQACC